MMELDPTRKKVHYNNKKNRKIPVAIFLVLFVVVILIYLVVSSKTPRSDLAGKVVAEPRSYIGKIEHARTIQPDFNDSQTRIKLADVDRLNIVDFELSDNKGEIVPVMAYITSSGRLFVGNSICACGGIKFSLAGEVLVCDSCRTTFTIEDQKFMSGSVTAGKNPPARIKSVVENGMIVIEQSDVGN